MANKRKVVVAVSGGFDPIHIGHIRMFQEAKKLGDSPRSGGAGKLVVILNNDNWLKKKKVHIFIHQKERKEILESIEGVDEVVLTHHSRNPKDMSVSGEILKIKPDIFANGGDRKAEKDILEGEACRKVGCKMVFNIGQGGKVQSSSWLLAKYVNKVKPARKLNIKKILKELEAVFKNSPPEAEKIKFPAKLRIKTSKIILKLMNRKRGFGLFIILGWQNKWRKYTDLPDSGQDIYVKHHQNILKHYRSRKHDIETTVNFDGAILVDRHGNIVHSGIIIEGLRPHIIADKIHPGHFKDLSEQFGFGEKVHSRHLSAITASYIFKGTTVFTVSEENDSFHVFEGGKIIYKMR
ncbi:MAG: adenylyltransferase/cytidyltransferase family protein [Candidatus Taylorbacteria bacterium]|nr:adenylyltransferase/cytidyltransferase family protein [Candidatus Taylorbacteria bacterium]